MKLGCFSVSLAVKDLEASRAFYAKLGFTEFAGDASQNWLILSNGDTKIGLFQGMFENNTLTFNPGWDQNGETLEDFEDVRSIRAKLVEAGIEVMSEIETESGPAHVVVVDPDGNPVLLDQHV